MPSADHVSNPELAMFKQLLLELQWIKQHQLSLEAQLCSVVSGQQKMQAQLCSVVSGQQKMQVAMMEVSYNTDSTKMLLTAALQPERPAGAERPPTAPVSPKPPLSSEHRKTNRPRPRQGAGHNHQESAGKSHVVQPHRWLEGQEPTRTPCYKNLPSSIGSDSGSCCEAGDEPKAKQTPRSMPGEGAAPPRRRRTKAATLDGPSATSIEPTREEAATAKSKKDAMSTKAQVNGQFEPQALLDAKFELRQSISAPPDALREAEEALREEKDKKEPKSRLASSASDPGAEEPTEDAVTPYLNEGMLALHDRKMQTRRRERAVGD